MCVFSYCAPYIWNNLQVRCNSHFFKSKLKTFFCLCSNNYSYLTLTFIPAFFSLFLFEFSRLFNISNVLNVIILYNVLMSSNVFL